MLVPFPACSAPRRWCWASVVGFLPLLRRFRGGRVVPVPCAGGGWLAMCILCSLIPALVLLLHVGLRSSVQCFAVGAGCALDYTPPPATLVRWS